MKAPAARNPAVPVRTSGDYATIRNAHHEAMVRRWIARMGYDVTTGLFWIEYVGRAL